MQVGLLLFQDKSLGRSGGTRPAAHRQERAPLMRSPPTAAAFFAPAPAPPILPHFIERVVRAWHTPGVLQWRHSGGRQPDNDCPSPHPPITIARRHFVSRCSGLLKTRTEVTAFMSLAQVALLYTGESASALEGPTWQRRSFRARPPEHGERLSNWPQIDCFFMQEKCSPEKAICLIFSDTWVKHQRTSNTLDCVRGKNK
jgi:hypothetical protein